MKWTNCFRWTERNKPSQEERGRHRHWCSSSRPEWDSFAKLTQNGCHNFRPVFIFPRLVSNCFSLPVFYSASTLTVSPLSLFKPIIAYRAMCCWFLFLTGASSAILTDIWKSSCWLFNSFLSYHRVPRAFSLSYCLESLIYVPSFSLSPGWQSKKQLTTKIINQSP